MINNIVIALRWSLSIGNKIFKVVPGATFLVILATLISQFSVVVASLLPLKVIILLGSDRIPGYFPDFFSSINRDFLVVSLSVLSVFFYFVHNFAEKLIASGTEKGGDLLLAKSQKMALFENQKEISSQGFHRFSKGVASVILILLISVGICWLYLDLFLVLLTYSVLCFFLLTFFYSLGGSIKVGLDDAPSKIVDTATGIGFLLSFGFIVVDFLWGTPPGLLVAVVSLILIRQGFSRISGLVGDFRGLYIQRLKLNALFFHGHVFIGEAKKHETNFWSFLQPSRRKQWIHDILNEVCEKTPEAIEVRWLQLGVSDMALLQVGNFSREGDCDGNYLLKLFSIHKSSLARHEATLLATKNSLPCLPLVRLDSVQGLHCHVLDFSGAVKLPKERFNEAKEEIFSVLMATDPDPALVSRFNRTHPPLWQRIDDDMLERLRTVAGMLDTEDFETVKKFVALRSEVSSRLKELPFSIINPDVGPNSIFESAEGCLVAIHWGRWTLEPIGAGWPVNAKQLARLPDVFEEVRKKRKSLRDINVNAVCLAALVFELEKMCARQQFESAVRIMPEIISCIEADAQPVMT